MNLWTSPIRNTSVRQAISGVRIFNLDFHLGFMLWVTQNSLCGDLFPPDPRPDLCMKNADVISPFDDTREGMFVLMD